jgi:hypothetical protein
MDDLHQPTRTYVRALRHRARRLVGARRAPQALLCRRGTAATVDIADLIDRQFLAFDRDYRAQHDVREGRLKSLKEQIEQTPGGLACSREIMIEAEWLLHYTADWATLDAQLARLQASLTQEQGAAHEQSADGSWGKCYSQWFQRLNGTLEEVGRLIPKQGDPLPKFAYELRFLDVISTPSSLIPMLYGRQLSDIVTNGVYQRDELGALQQSLSQFLYKDDLRGVLVANGAAFLGAPAYKTAYRRFLDATQDDTTGFWGPWLMVDGVVQRAIDLSFTFHTVSYLKGDVRRWPEIIDTLFAIKDLPYPFGWRVDGKFNNHNNYDVARLMRRGWSQMTPLQQVDAAAAIREMLAWTLNESLDAKGAFKSDPFYDSEGELYYFGIVFLAEVGFWKPDTRFWTDDKTLDPKARWLCTQLRKNLEPLVPGSNFAADARDKLNDNCPVPAQAAPPAAE